MVTRKTKDFVKKRILFIAGTRPNFMKVAPLLRECRRYPNIEPILLHTGQHYDDSMSGTYFRELEIQKPDITLESNKYRDEVQQKEYIATEIFKQYKNSQLSLIVVVGDVNSTAGGALGGQRLGVPVAHVEAGLRSFDDRMPEEHNRILVDQLSSILFVTEPSGIRNLKHTTKPSEDRFPCAYAPVTPSQAELRSAGYYIATRSARTSCVSAYIPRADARGFTHRNKKIFLVGNVMIDSLYFYLKKIKKIATYKRMHLKRKQYVVVTLHRKENLENPEIFAKLLRMITEIARLSKVVWPLHPRTRKLLEERGFLKQLATQKNILLTEPLPYFELISVVSTSLCVVTDSGGIQDETTVLNIPCLTIRRSTERPITATVGSSTLVGEDMNKLLRQFARIRRGLYKKSSIPRYWDGKASERILEIIERIL